MKINNLQLTKATWDTTSHPCQHSDKKHDSEHICEAVGVTQKVNLTEYNGLPRQLNEATYKELTSMIDGNFLNQRIRTSVLKGIKLLGFENNIMHFSIESSEFAKNGIRYMMKVEFDNWDEVGQDQDLDFTEKARMLLWVGDIKLHCSDPSFLYWGYNYILTVIDSAIYPEERKPNIRNPQDRGVVCKHLNRLLSVLPFYSGPIATALKKQYG